MAICSNCGAEIASGKKFCTKCGTPVGATAETSPAKASAASAPAPAATPTASPAQVQGNPEIISTGAYVGQALLQLIPVVGLVVYILWACGLCKSISRRNYAKATLILWAVGLVLGIIITIIVSVTAGSIFSSYSSLLW